MFFFFIYGFITPDTPEIIKNYLIPIKKSRELLSGVVGSVYFFYS